MLRKEAFYLKLAANFITLINRPLSSSLLKYVSNSYGLGLLFSKDQINNRIFWPSLQFNLAEELLNFTIDLTEYLYEIK
jgi:hypothetical protein